MDTLESSKTATAPPMAADGKWDLSADFARYLPVRWKFHCHLSAPDQWNVHRWRRYLLDRQYPIDLVELLDRNDFLSDVRDVLRAYGVSALEDLPKFWELCVEEYKAALASQENPFGD